MLLDLDQLRPKNESYEHFFLKQVGRAYLFKQGVRCIGTEVGGVFSRENPPFGTPKHIIDVLGVDIRNKRDEAAFKLRDRIHSKALQIGKKRGILKGDAFPSTYFIKDKDEQVHLEKEVEICYRKACEELGFSKTLHHDLHWFSERQFQLRGIEVKVSYSDFRNGFSMLPEYSYILAPKGIVPVNELPSKVGLLEFDFERYRSLNSRNKGEVWFQSLKLVKKPKKTYDPSFFVSKNGNSKFDKYTHALACQNWLFTLAQQNTEEHIFWNPHLRYLDNIYVSDEHDTLFLYPVGKKTPLGTVSNRRVGEYTYTDEEMKERVLYTRKTYRMPYYQFVANDGVSKWISQSQAERTHKGFVHTIAQKRDQISSHAEAVTFYMTCKENGVTWSHRDGRDVSIDDLNNWNEGFSLTRLQG